MFQNVQDVLNARLAIAHEREQLEAGEVKIAQHALTVIFDGGDELMTALENAMWMDKTVHEVGHPTNPRRQARIQRISQGKLVEGVDNDGLTDAEATAALDER